MCSPFFCRYKNGKGAELVKGVYTDVLDPLFASALGTTLPAGWPDSCPALAPICPKTKHTCNDHSHNHHIEALEIHASE